MSNPLANPMFVGLQSEKPSTFRVYYSRVPQFGVKESTPVFLEDYIFLGTVNAVHPDGVFDMMQADAWSPHGEACTLIRSLGLTHTSMSVGDLLYDPQLKTYWRCMPYGWQLWDNPFPSRNPKA